MSEASVGADATMKQRAGTGIAGLDHILNGGLPRNRIYLVEGSPGTGKTTLSMQFLLEGARQGERALYIALSETQAELKAVADGHGWSLENLNVFELTPREEVLDADEQYTLFHPSEVEFNEVIRAILDELNRSKPTRVVFDSLSEMRLLARDPLRYRRQIFALKQYFSGRSATVLLLDDRASNTDDQVQSIVNGVISLEQLPIDYGSDRRRIRIVKMRSVPFRGGYHDFEIMTGGVRIFPRLVSADSRTPTGGGVAISGVPELDQLTGGGLDRGTSALIMGPAGAGKSVLATQYACAAAERGEKVMIYTFDEIPQTLLKRSEGLGINLEPQIKSGRVTIEQVDPAELSPGELAYRIREAVQNDDAGVVVIDSLNGYLNAMPEERFLIVQMHELLTFLNQRGVLTLLIAAQHGLLGSAMQAPIDVTYLADTVLLMRYFESAGRVKKAISVVKKRSGQHEDSIREFSLSSKGIRVGSPLEKFHGILTGVPSFYGSSSQLERQNSAG